MQSMVKLSLSISPSVSISLTISLPILAIHLSISPFYLYLYLFIYLTMYPSISLSIFSHLRYIWPINTEKKSPGKSAWPNTGRPVGVYGLTVLFIPEGGSFDGSLIALGKLRVRIPAAESRPPSGFRLDLSVDLISSGTHGFRELR